MQRETCKDCRFFNDESRGRGSCHLNPPKMFMKNHGAPTQTLESYWPPVRHNDFCGAHARKARN